MHCHNFNLLGKFPKGALGADMANPAFETISLHYLDLSTWEDVKYVYWLNYKFLQPFKNQKFLREDVQIFKFKLTSYNFDSIF